MSHVTLLQVKFHVTLLQQAAVVVVVAIQLILQLVYNLKKKTVRKIENIKSIFSFSGTS